METKSPDPMHLGPSDHQMINDRAMHFAVLSMSGKAFEHHEEREDALVRQAKKIKGFLVSVE